MNEFKTYSSNIKNSSYNLHLVNYRQIVGEKIIQTRKTFIQDLLL